MKKTKKMNVMIVILILGLVGMSCVSYACTSFAVFSANNLYGMNFDYPETELRLMLYNTDGGKAFSMEFKQGQEFIPIAGMNSDGLFVAMQMMYPKREAAGALKPDEIYTGELGALIGVYDEVKDIEAYIEDKRLVHMPVTVHQLFADKTGDAMIVEAGDEGNEIIRSEKDFIVMTNFTNADYVDTPIEEIYGIGADRYQQAYEHIEQNFNEFDVESAWTVLNDTAQSSGGYPTLASMVFDPGNGEVYIVLDRDFEKVWKLSLESETIVLIGDGQVPLEIKIEPEGILASELLMAVENGNDATAELGAGSDVTVTETSAPDHGGEPSEGERGLNWLPGFGILFLLVIVGAVIIKVKNEMSKK